MFYGFLCFNTLGAGVQLCRLQGFNVSANLGVEEPAWCRARCFFGRIGFIPIIWGSGHVWMLTVCSHTFLVVL